MSLPISASQFASFCERMLHQKDKFISQFVCPQLPANLDPTDCGQHQEMMVSMMDKFYVSFVHKLKTNYIGDRMQNSSSDASLGPNQLDPQIFQDSTFNDISESSPLYSNAVSTLRSTTSGCSTSIASKSSTKPKAFFCPYPTCDRSFARKDNLKIHKLIHQGVKPFRCTWPSCHYSTSHGTTQLRNHIRRRHFKVPFSVEKQKQAKILVDGGRNVNDFILVDKALLKEGNVLENEIVGAVASASNETITDFAASTFNSNHAEPLPQSELSQVDSYLQHGSQYLSLNDSNQIEAITCFPDFNCYEGLNDDDSIIFLGSFPPKPRLEHPSILSANSETASNQASLQVSEVLVNTNSKNSSKCSKSSKGNKSLKCPYASCDRLFRDKCYLRSHVLLYHKGIKPYHCGWPSCQYTSAQYGNVKMHIRNVHLRVPISAVQQKRAGLISIDNGLNMKKLIGVDQDALKEALNNVE